MDALARFRAERTQRNTDLAALKERERQLKTRRAEVNQQLGTPEPRTFRTAAQADAYYRENAPVQAADLSAKEARALRAYQGTGYQDINAALRSGKRGNAEERAVIAGVDSTMQRSRLREPAEVHRGMVVQPGTPAARILDSLRPGATFRDSGYTSTTVDKSVADNFTRSGARGASQVAVKIRVPVGARAVYMNSVLPKQGMLDFTKEREMLLDRNTQFRVVSRRDGRNGKVEIELEVVLDD
jgi:hypothetical protein